MSRVEKTLCDRCGKDSGQQSRIRFFKGGIYTNYEMELL